MADDKQETPEEVEARKAAAYERSIQASIKTKDGTVREPWEDNIY
jgi:hypothetical protein